MSAEWMSLILVAGSVAFAGIAMAVIPWIVRKTEVFAVTVPASVVNDERLVALRRSYALATGGLSALLTLAVIAVGVVGQSSDGAALVGIVASLAIVVVPFMLMLWCRAKVRDIKQQEGWIATQQVRISPALELELPRPFSVAWELVHVVFVAVAVILAITLLPEMPARVPIHFDAAGVPNGWVEKGPAVIALPVGCILFLGACMTFAHVSALRAKRGTDPQAAALSAYGYAAYLRAELGYLVAIGAVYDLMIVLTIPLMAGKLSLDVFMVVVFFVMLVTLGGIAWLFAVYGQNGSRVVARVLAQASLQEEQGTSDVSLVADEDKYWRAGVFYVNPQDPAVFLPKRFGMGWTLNFARPVAWLVLFGICALTVGFIVSVQFFS